MKRVWQRFGTGAVLAGALLVAAGPAAAADPVRIGVVDLQRCLNESKLGKKYKAEFVTEADDLKAALDREEEQLKALRESLEKQSMVLSETARAEKEREYKEKLDSFKERFKESQKTLQRKDQELMRMIMKDLQEVIRDLGETGGYTAILERTESMVLYFPSQVDLTDEVVRRYDRTAGD
jgi:outer membrane protein